METKMNITTARRILQLGKKASPEHVLMNFGAMISQGHIPEKMTQNDVMNARDFILRKHVNDSVAERGFFDIKSPFDNPCERCHGTGEIYKLKREETESENCKSCQGEGTVWIPCRNCKGTGRFIQKENGRKVIDVECTSCMKFKDSWPPGKEFHYLVLCQECRGKNKKAKMVGLESTTPCHKCKGIGFFPKKVENPALPFENLAQVIEKIEPEVDMPPTDRVSALQIENQETIAKMFDE